MGGWVGTAVATAVIVYNRGRFVFVLFLCLLLLFCSISVTGQWDRLSRDGRHTFNLRRETDHCHRVTDSARSLT